MGAVSRPAMVAAMEAATIEGVSEEEMCRRLGTTRQELIGFFHHKQAPSPAFTEALDAVDLLGALPTEPPGAADTRGYVEMLHAAAAGQQGTLRLASFGEDPLSGASIPPEIRSFAIGDVDGMTKAALDLTRQHHRNVYAALTVWKPDLPAGKKGRKQDVAGVLGIVADFDDDQAHDWASRSPLPPDFVVETSPGRFQCGFMFDRPVPLATAEALAAGLQRASRADHCTKDVTHVWRIPGCRNWPNKKKVDAGRPLGAVRSKFVKPWAGTRTAVAQLEAVLPLAPAAQPSATQANLAVEVPRRPIPAELQRLIEEPAPHGQRSDVIFEVVLWLQEIGHSQEEVRAIIEEQPYGIGEKFGGDSGRIANEVERVFRKGRPPMTDPEKEFGLVDIGPEVAPAPLDLFGDDDLAGQPRFPTEVLPAPLQRFVADRAERLGVCPGMIGMPALVACAAVLPDAIKVQPRVYDTGWAESGRLWLSVVEPPGGKKTPAIGAAVTPLHKIEAKWARDDDFALADYEARKAFYEVRMKDYKTKAAKAAEAAEAAPPRPEQPARPPRRRVLVGDFTMEALAGVLADNPAGVLALADELTGLICSFDAYRSNGGGRDRAKALELYNGGPQLIDRAGRKDPVRVPNWSACIVGGTQPDKLRKLRGTLDDDGFMQRFMVIHGTPPTAGEDRVPDKAAEEGYIAVLEALAGWRAEALPEIVVKLSPAAQVERQQVARVAEALKILPDTPPALRGHLAKWDALFARLALVFHVVETAQGVLFPNDLGEIPGGTAAAVRRLMLEYLLPHACRFYGEVYGHGEDQAQARWVAGYILAHELQEVTERDIYRPYRELREDRAALHRATDILELAGWLQPISNPNRGRATKWKVSPEVHRLFSARAEAERVRRAAELAKIQEAREAKRQLATS